jgi:hypothetical protein
MATKLRTRRNVSLGAALTIAWLLTVSVVHAQQINGVPGSPSATMTLDGKQLPPPPMKFGGVIKESYLDSKPYWPPRVVPPKGVPNVLLIMTRATAFRAPSAASSRRPHWIASPRRDCAIPRFTPERCARPLARR